MATIRDVARISGYSISTVSRALNQSGYVSKTAQLKINRVIHELDYVPNAIARDLSTGKTHKIGVILPHIRDPYFSKILNGIMDAAFATNYSVILLPSEYDEGLEMHYLEQLKRKEYDGLIVTSHGIPLERLEKYNQYGPIVCCEDTGTNQLMPSFLTVNPPTPAPLSGSNASRSNGSPFYSAAAPASVPLVASH